MYVYTRSFYLCHRKDLEMHLSSSQFFPLISTKELKQKMEKRSTLVTQQQQHVDEIFLVFL